MEHKLTELQTMLLKMLYWFHTYCVDHNLCYYLIEGSMIGAARHAGFIPWDDDIDIGMPREDYDILCSSFSDSSKRYVLECPDERFPDHIYSWSKLYDSTTTFVGKSRFIIKKGIYLDIFPIDGVGQTKREAVKFSKRINLLSRCLACRTCEYRKERKLYKNAAIYFFRLLPKSLIDEHKLACLINNECKKKTYDESNYVSCMLSTYMSKEIMKKEIYGKPKLYPFEDIEVYGPECFDQYLSTIYGNWRELPPKEEQVPNHDFYELNLHRSYLE